MKSQVKPILWPRADKEALAAFDPNTKHCDHNCGRHKDDPRTDKERLYLCDVCGPEWKIEQDYRFTRWPPPPNAPPAA